MVLDADQMKRQADYETAFHWLKMMLTEGLITSSEYDSEVRGIERKYNPIIVHIPLLYKE